MQAAVGQPEFATRSTQEEGSPMKEYSQAVSRPSLARLFPTEGWYGETGDAAISPFFHRQASMGESDGVGESELATLVHIS